MRAIGAKPSLADRIDLQSNAIWAECFSPATREEQLADDLFAGRSVTGVLFAVVCLGTLLMALTVWLCL
jgi:hypothetical protein